MLKLNRGNNHRSDLRPGNHFEIVSGPACGTALRCQFFSFRGVTVRNSQKMNSRMAGCHDGAQGTDPS
jgi:hypothetical protein